MSADPTNQASEKPVARGVRRLWDGVLPESLGLCLVAIIFGGLAAGYTITAYSWDQHREAAHQTEADMVARSVAASLGAVAEGEQQSIDMLVSGVGCQNRVRSVCWTSPEGGVRASWPSAMPAVASTTDAPKSDGGVPVVMAKAPVRTPDGKPAGELRIELAAQPSTGYGASVLWAWGTATGVTLLAFVALYRRLRRHLRPMAAIELNLQSFTDDVEQELRTLTLSDSLGGVAQGWNRLISQLNDLRKQLADSQTTSHASVMARFEGVVFRRVIERLPCGVICVNPDRRVSFVNASAAALLSRSREEMSGKPVREALENPSIVQAVLAAQSRGGGSRAVDHTVATGEHQLTLRLHVLALATEGSDGDVVIAIEDVSQIRENERTRDNFLYHVTHELRTPLTNIHAYTETLTQPGFDDEQTRKECYNVIISETRRLSSLVENILSVSQLEAGSARLDIGEVDMTRLLRQMVQDNLGRADEKKIDLTLALPPKMPKVRGDKERLAVLLNNLIGNAVKYTPDGGAVQVKVSVDGGQLLIAVEDSGIGISAVDHEHVFDKFYRAAHDFVQTTTGTGLGLSLAREVARLHGGDIQLKSELGRGSTFTIELPLSSHEQAEVTAR